MNLGAILKNKNNVRIKEYELYGDGLIFVGGCYYAGGRLIALDGGFYSLDTPVDAYEWLDNGTLMIVR